MRVHDAYELVFGQDAVVVHRTERTGSGGHPIYADDTGIVLAEISDRGEVRMLRSGGYQDPVFRVQARPVQPHTR
ncbi:hypothetical protein C6N75_26310 [Streptomyces solincola]|uniref:Uncharacterized protein n=1 Tax=Streptomyces solincola TaxID=2100817 RepID=A0A2S9PPI4_9ACTN|nr:DUF6296 family protein [Streptomyces solincola]PRH76314.1 hypothetical protein C6N75_26310 [Streptomyces solincola]